MQNKDRSFIFLLLILISGFILRLYRFNNPIADWHSWRQADTSAVSRMFVSTGFDLLHPRFEDLSNVPSGLENPRGYRFVEFPLYNAVQAGLYKVIGIFTLEEWGRLITIFSSLATAIFLYGIVKRRKGTLAGLLTAGFFAFLPYNIYYGRTILPDPSMSMAITGAIYFFEIWMSAVILSKAKNIKRSISESGRIRITASFFLSLFFATIAFLLKPYAIIFALPMIYLAYEKFGFSIWKKWQLWMFAVVSMTPLFFWRLWMRQYPQGIPASGWLLNGNGIRFKPAFFRWIGYERLTKLISGYVGVFLLAIGFWQMIKKKDWFFLTWIAALILYVCIFATGNVQHDYYQILIMPAIAIAIGLGSWYFLEIRVIKKPFSIVLLAMSYVLLASFSWMQVKDYFNINNPSIVVAGEAVDRLTPKNAKVIANYEGDTSFLYQTNRQGWPSFEHDIPEMIKLGADYLVLANPKPQDLAFGKTYKIVRQTPQYILFDLHQKP